MLSLMSLLVLLNLAVRSLLKVTKTTSSRLATTPLTGSKCLFEMRVLDETLKTRFRQSRFPSNVRLMMKMFSIGVSLFHN